MTLKEIEDQLTDLEALPREAALVTLKLLGMDLFHELDAAWFEDAENQVKMAYWSELYERATRIAPDRRQLEVLGKLYDGPKPSASQSRGK